MHKEPRPEDFIRDVTTKDSLVELLKVAKAVGGANITTIGIDPELGDVTPDAKQREQIEQARQAANLGSSILKLKNN